MLSRNLQTSSKKISTILSYYSHIKLNIKLTTEKKMQGGLQGKENHVVQFEGRQHPLKKENCVNIPT